MNVHVPTGANRAYRGLPPHVLFFGDTYMYTCMYVYKFINLHKCAYANESISLAFAANSLVRSNICVYMYICTHVHICIYVYKYTYANESMSMASAASSRLR